MQQQNNDSVIQGKCNQRILHHEMLSFHINKSFNYLNNDVKFVNVSKRTRQRPLTAQCSKINKRNKVIAKLLNILNKIFGSNAHFQRLAAKQSCRCGEFSQYLSL